MTAQDSSKPTSDDETVEERSVVSQVADYVVYAPLGLAFDARDLFPGLVTKGRNQATILKMVGRFAVQQGSTKGRSAIVELGSQAVSMIPGVSVIDAADDEIDDAAAEIGTEHLAASEPASSGTEGADAEPEPDAGGDEPAAPEPPTVDVSTLAIPDYDSLSALQVVPRLEGLTPAELEAVRDYEAATRARRTILNKVAQLQAG